MIFWITGITASGKTTLGKKLEEHLINNSFKNVLRLDGDTLRSKKNWPSGYSIEKRFEIIKLIVEICEEELIKNKIVIVSTVSHKKFMREYARSKLINFNEIYLDALPELCAQRDYKGLYKKYNDKPDDIFPGVTDHYELSQEVELIIPTTKLDLNASIFMLNNFAMNVLRNKSE